MALRLHTISTCALLAGLVCATMAHNGGCHPDDGEPLPSPAHALAVVLEVDGALEVEMVLVSTATSPASHVDGADATLVLPDGETIVVEERDPGRYAAWIDATYQATAPYTFDFALDEGTASRHRADPGAFRLAVHGGMEVPNVWTAEGPDGGLDVSWSPGGMTALVQVFDETRETYTTLDWSDPDIDAKTWRTLPSGGRHHIPAAAFDGEGEHAVRVCAVEVFRRDGDPKSAPQHALDGHGDTSSLGWLSGGIAGRCVWAN